tara:strand:- start:6216 stop:9281 length:3066 start_codon:yes stop_codon:yes gene_type:complete
MSGAAGGVIINKEDLKATIRDYRETVLKPLNLDKSYNITGVRRRPEKNTFGDIDIVLSFPGGDKKQLKKDFAQHLEQIDKIPNIPRKKNKKYFIHGSIVTNLYPIVGKPDQYVQIDNIITPSEDEGKFTYSMLDLPAQEQGLTLGLAKAIFTELNPSQIEQLFKDLNIPQNIEKPKEGEEYDFNLNTSGLSLKIAPIGKSFGKEIWKSSKFNDTKTLLKSLGVDIENDKFRDIVKVVKNFKSRRSIDRLKGMFAKNIRVSDTEVGRDKGIKKQQALDKVASLEEKFSPLVMSLISPLILENEEKPKIAIFPGKFKPPHKDHLARIIAASKFVGPLGTVKVIISPKSTKEDPNQETITAKQSLSVFNLYKSKGIIPDNVKIEISQYPSPVVSAWKEFETNKDKPQEEQQPYIAVFGKNETKRYAGVLKIPNITINDFPEAEVGNESATSVRTALKNGDDITRFLPNGIDPKEYKQALGLNAPINEADPKKGTGKKPKGSSRRLYTDEDPKDTVGVKFSTRQDIIDTLNKTSFKSKSHARQSQVINLIHQRLRAAYSRAKDPAVKKRLKSGLNYITKKKEASKKKTQRLKDQKENIDPKAQSKHKGKSSPFGSAYEKVDETGLKIAKKNMDDYKRSNTLNENTTYSNHIDYKQQIENLTKHMLKKGMNIKPLPKIIFKHNNEENAKDFLGKTAYYDPNNKVVVLYTEGRHPKDVVRSYAHEMIHHIQNLEGRLKNISTTNTMEDDYLNDIEREAYTKGNMLFRNYTDGIDGEEVTSLNEKEKPYKHKHGFDDKLGKDPFGLNQYARELASLEEGRYDTLSNQISRDIFNFWKEDFNEGEVDSTYEDDYNFPPRGIQVYAQIIYKPGFGKLKIDGGSDYAYTDKETGKKYPGFVKVTFIVDPKMLPEFWEEISMNLKDVVRHEIEHITQSGDSKTKKEDFDEDFDMTIRALVKADIIPQAEYFKLPKEVDANLQGMYFRAKKERRPFIDVINTYLDAQDITPKDKQIILNLWRSRRKALSLPEF